MTLADLLDGPAVQVEPHEPLARVAQRMYDANTTAVLVLREDGEIAGIFTERDLLRACAAGVDTQAATVGRWMTADPVTAPAHAAAGAALATMIERSFRHLPVVGEGGVLGIVSMRALSAHLQRAAQD
jgi:signal-transduction protein with cAMP-binding, CBS, and nucleotidyltransferase domain